MTYHEFIQVLLDRASAEGAPASGSLAYLGFAPASYTIKVAGKPNWVWVRLAEEDERTPTQALNLAQVRLFPDLPVRVRKEGGVLAVVGYDPATIDAFLGNRPINITSPEASEPDLVGPRRIKPGLVHAYKADDTYSMTVQVEGFWYLDPATRKATYQPPGTLDLTSHIPAGANQHVYALVVFDRASKTFSAISGTPKLVTLPLDDGDITGIAVGSAVPLCAVKLATGMTALDKDYYFVDVRPWWTIADEPLLVAGGAPLTINAGAVTAVQTYHILAAETDTTDDLDTVTAAAANTFLLLQADTGDTITVKHGTGNIQLNGAADFVLSGDKTLLLFFDGTTWSDVGAGGGGGGALADHDHSGDAGDGGTFDAANLTSGVATDGQVLTADGVGGAAWENPVGGGASQLSDLSDVNTSTPTNRNVLVADGVDWESRALEAADIQSGILAHERGGLEADVSAYGGLALISGGATSELKLNLNASAAPTVNDDSASGYGVGSRWVDTINDKEYVCLDASTGAAVWTETTQAGTGGGSPISVTTKTIQTHTVLYSEVLASAGRFDVSNLSQDYDHLLIRLWARSSVSNTSDEIWMFFNNDTTASNYHSQRSGAQDGTTTLNAEKAEPRAQLVTGNTGPDNAHGYIEAFIPHYTGSHHKVANVTNIAPYGPGQLSRRIAGIIWGAEGGTAAINRITVQPDGYGADSFVAGSRIEIVGVKEETVVTSVTGGTAETSAADVSNPPLDAELDSAFGTPAEVGSGFVGLLDDNGADTDVYVVASNGVSWWYTALTKAT